MSLIIVGLAGAHNIQGFGIDADHATATDALFSGNQSADDWAQGASQQGMFALSTSTPHTAAADCYGSNIDLNTSAPGTSALICDGNSDTKFKVTEPEQNIVSPSGKTGDGSWPIKPGNVRPKNDFSHAYVHARVGDSPCDGTGDNDDTILYLGGHVGDNEGDHFWGFEFDKNAPTNFSQLTSNSGDSFTMGFNRSIGDILVSFTVPGSAGSPVVVEVFKVTAIDPVTHEATFTLAGALPGCPTGGSDVPNLGQGFTLLTTNEDHDVTAPPWKVPVCDPTADNSANQCRLASSTTPAEDLLAPRDFAEAAVDLTAFGISPCFTNVIFTSRSSHVLGGADVQDVGGANFPLCGKKTGVKFHDLNANGVKDSGDSGLNGWPIKLYSDTNADKNLTAADFPQPSGFPKNSTTSTIGGVAGTYEFTSLATGDYVVCEVAQPGGTLDSGWTQSAPNASTTLPAGESLANCGGDASVTLGGKGYAFHMTGLDVTGNDFGNYRNGVVKGVKFKDVDVDGVKDAAPPETRLSGWTIRAYKDADADGVLEDADDGTTDSTFTVFASTTTCTGTELSGPCFDNSLGAGEYRFSLPPGDYIICEVKQTGWDETLPNSGTGTKANCSAVTALASVGYKVNVTSDSSTADRDFGNTPLSAITVNFNPLAKLPDGTTDATKATNITCTSGGSSVAPAYVAGSNTLTTNNVKLNQSQVTCVITYTDP